MAREVGDSVPYFNENKELVASFNTFYKVLYWGNKATEEDKAKVLKDIEKKKYKNFTIFSMEPVVITGKKKNTQSENEEAQEDISLIQEPNVEPEVKPKKATTKKTTAKKTTTKKTTRKTKK